MEDSELITRFKQHNDSAAFAALIAKYENRVYRFGLKMCGHVEDAEDVVQDTFVSAFRFLKDFRGDASLLTWLMKIASSACLKKRRLRKNQPRDFLPFDEAPEPGRGLEESSQSQRPEGLVISREIHERLQTAIAKLPEHYRIVLVLRDMEGLSVKETAETLDLTESAVKVRLHRARAMLFRLYNEVDDEDPGGEEPLQ